MTLLVSWCLKESHFIFHLFSGRDAAEVSSIASSPDNEFVISDYNSFPPVDDVISAICS